MLLMSRDPGYQWHCRADRRPILGDTIPERWARLGRLHAAIAAAGWGEAETNRHAHRTYGVVGIELLTADHADALIAMLAPARER